MISLPEQASVEELLSAVRPVYPDALLPLGAGVWWGLCGVAVLAFGARFVYNSVRMKRRREAFAVLEALRQAYAKEKDLSALASGVSVLMRRVAVFRNKTAAGIFGREWTEYLMKTGAKFDENDVRLLSEAAFAPADYADDMRQGGHLLTAVRGWMEKNL